MSDDEDSGFYGEYETTSVDLPTGSYTFLFLSDEVSEEDAKKVVECDSDGDLCFNYHRVHSGSTMPFCASALESLASLLTHSGISGTVAVLEKIK